MECKRPGCGEAENRINGYCSNYCEDMHDMESQLAAAVERGNTFHDAADAQLKVAMQQRARAEKAERERDEARNFIGMSEVMIDRDRLAGEVVRKDTALSDLCEAIHAIRGDLGTRYPALSEAWTRAQAAMAQPVQPAQGKAPGAQSERISNARLEAAGEAAEGADLYVS